MYVDNIHDRDPDNLYRSLTMQILDHVNVHLHCVCGLTILKDGGELAYKS